MQPATQRSSVVKRIAYASSDTDTTAGSRGRRFPRGCGIYIRRSDRGVPRHDSRPPRSPRPWATIPVPDRSREPARFSGPRAARKRRTNEQGRDLGGGLVRASTAGGARQPHALRGSRGRRPDRAAPRQPDLVVPLAQRDSPSRRAGAAAWRPISSGWATPARRRAASIGFVDHARYLDAWFDRPRLCAASRW